MNKPLFLSTFLTLSTLVSSVQAGIVITGTRVIYPSNKEFVPVQLSNVGEKVALVQTWVDEKDVVGDPTTTKAPFIVTPPITTVEADKGQSLRLIFNGKAQLPTDRESMFWLNVLDIPTKPEIETNYLQFAIRSRLKLFYRPTQIKIQQQQAFEKIEVTRTANTFEINNPTPYFMNFAKSSLIAKTGEETEIKDVSYIEPFSKQIISHANVANSKSAKLSLISDYGSVVTIEKNF